MTERHVTPTTNTDLPPWAGRAVLHVDMDAFFASVEQLDHPAWRGKPVVVGGSPDARGVIAAASYEARAYGVRSAMPSARAAVLLPPDAIWTRGSFDRYGEVSAQVFRIFAEVTPDVQAASIDEAYLDVTPSAGGTHPVDVARRIQRTVDELGVSCSIGVATNRTVAKIASDRNKPHGITVVWPGDEAAFLAPLPIRLMPGIGPTTADKLSSLGLRTLGEIAALDDTSARHALGPHGPSLVLRAQGIDPRPVVDREPVKSVSNERTFAEDLHDVVQVEQVLAGLADKVGGRLRRKELAGRTVHLKLRFGDFTTKTCQVTLREPTASTQTILESALDLLRGIWAPGVGVRLLGVGVSGFDAALTQLSLLPDEAEGADPRRNTVERTVDEVRRRFGEGAVRFGSRRSPSHDPRDRYGPG